MPTHLTLERYAHVLVNFALGSGAGMRAGEVVLLSVPECARPILEPLYEAVLRAGGHPLVEILPDGLQRTFFAHADEAQLLYRPTHRMMGTVQDIDHRLVILAEHEKYELSWVASDRIMRRYATMKPYREAMNAKEHQGKLTWTLGLYGTPAMASFAGMSLEEYWEEIIHACYLDHDDPISAWKQTEQTIHELANKLNALKIQSVHMVGADMDLTIKIGSDRAWLGGGGRNIPSFEIFTSPDWRGTEGWIRFNMPLCYQSSIIRGIALRFHEGLVVEATATENEDLLKHMIAQVDANKAGEFSLTDRRLSRITRFMGETLYDENVGGPFGNTHIAFGMAYRDAFVGDIAGSTEDQWADRGYNDSVVHTDIMSTTDRTVTATLEDGSQRIIYQGGEFVI